MQPTDYIPSLGTIRANGTDYDGGVKLERLGADGWAVPAWEEQGLGDLAGPFPSWEAAAFALASAQAMGRV